MIRAVVLSHHGGYVRIRLDGGGKVYAINSLNRRPPLGSIVFTQRLNGTHYIVGRPR